MAQAHTAKQVMALAKGRKVYTYILASITVKNMEEKVRKKLLPRGK